MRRVDASAPGKAVLVGEYAVLHGAPALVLAVDRRVRVTIRSCGSGRSRLEVPQLAADPLALEFGSDGCLRWPASYADRPELDLCRNLLTEALGQAGHPTLPGPGGLQIRIDSAELFLQNRHSHSKLGLGSSAAVTVALTAALQAYLRGSERGARPSLPDLLESHRRQQGGRGSGLDLAAALEGGLLAYRLVDQRPQYRTLVWPADWPLLFVWSGESASTGAFLQRYQQWRAVDPKAADDLWRAMDDCAREAVACIESGARERFMTCINNYCELMGKIGDRIHAPVLSPRHQRLAAIALESGAAYKPCGAGGGDLGMFMAADDVRLEQLRSRIQAQGFGELALKPALTGLQLALTDNARG